MQKRYLYSVVLILLVMTPVLTSGHGGETTEDEPISLTLEAILLLTIFTGVILLIFLSKVVGIEDNQLLIKVGMITMLLLGLDYVYVRYFG